MSLLLIGAQQEVAWSAPRDLTAQQSNAWYGTQFAVTGGLTLASAALLLPATYPVRPRLVSTPDFEKGTWKNFSQSAAQVSDVSFLLTATLPVATLGATAQGHSWGNSLFIYGEAMGASLLANVIVKRSVRRSRPYTHGKSAEARAEQARSGEDAYYSFYSGHSALSFTAATASSVLFAAVNEKEGLRAAHWGLSLGLASFTAHARVRAGRHYPTDVFVGVAAGFAVGFIVPALQQVSLKISPGEAMAGLGGSVLGASAAFLLPHTPAEEWAIWMPEIYARPGGASLHLRGQF